ncbi:MAG: winged helix-turn-helix transcriptional regulator, partial [Deltaproteobacteria bacterium]|nr:winged helix-turn-helix transcriptional regulator [Deltaproteobacteria bacterium]
MDLVEQIGSGILRINNALAGYGMSPPDIESDDAWYCIVFKRSESAKNGVKTDGFDKASNQDADVNATVNATVKLTAIQKNIIKQVQDNPNVTYNILADLLKKNRTTIYRNMEKLKQVNILE